MDDKFDYDKALAELEAIAARVEDPATPLDDIGSLVERSKVLVKNCREYLRSVRESVETGEEES